MAPVLAAIPNHLAIEGHTNQAPTRPKFYASEWELSSARAVTVLRRLSRRQRARTRTPLRHRIRADPTAVARR